MVKKRMKKYIPPLAAAMLFAFSGCTELTDVMTRPAMPAADNENHPAAMRDNAAGDAQPATPTSVLNGLISFPE